MGGGTNVERMPRRVVVVGAFLGKSWRYTLRVRCKRRNFKPRRPARRFGSGARKLATGGAASWLNMALTYNMIARRQIDRTQLLQFGKVILLLAKREELLVKLPAMTQPTKEIVPIEGLGRAS
jgi:hypothetical protein